MFQYLEKVGALALFNLSRIGAMGIFWIACLRPKAFSWQRMVSAIYLLGVSSWLAVVLAGFLAGLVMTLAIHDAMAPTVNTAELGAAVGFGLVRALGAPLTIILMTVFAGPELYTSGRRCQAVDGEPKQTESAEMLALLLAAAVCGPLLTAIFDVCALAGSYLASILPLQMDGGRFGGGLVRGIGWDGIESGLLKSLLSGMFVVGVCAAPRRGAPAKERTLAGVLGWSCVGMFFANFLIEALLR